MGLMRLNSDDKSYITRLIETELSIRNVEAISPPIVDPVPEDNWSSVPSNKQKQKSSLESRNFASLNVMFHKVKVPVCDH